MSLPPEIYNPILEFLKKNSWIIIIIILLVFIAYGSVAFLGKNNAIELEIEKVIETETGVHVDLTP